MKSRNIALIALTCLALLLVLVSVLLPWPYQVLTAAAAATAIIALTAVGAAAIRHWQAQAHKAYRQGREDYRRDALRALGKDITPGD